MVLIEGRNRELRKMFGAIGHFVEKIRRVGYGPLVLDLEPGKMRELDEDEVNALRLTAEGKMKPRRAKAGRCAEGSGPAGEAARREAWRKTGQRGVSSTGVRRAKRERGAAPERGTASRDNRFVGVAEAGGSRRKAAVETGRTRAEKGMATRASSVEAPKPS